MLTVRMNWMDAERSQSADVQLSKDSKDIPVYHRNKLYHHRAQVASVIRQQLATIQRELNGDTNAHQSEQAKATEAITALIKGQRYRDGKLYTSYIDGTSHEGTDVVRAYNAYCRQRLEEFLEENKDISAIVPAASEFDVTHIEQLIDDESALLTESPTEEEDEIENPRSVLRKQIDAARAQYNQKAQKCARYLTSFVGIRNARLSDGFEMSAQSEPSHSPPTEDDILQNDAPSDNHPQHSEALDADAGDNLEDVQESDEIRNQSDEKDEDEVAHREASQSDAEDSEGDLVLRDGTVALNSTASPRE